MCIFQNFANLITILKDCKIFTTIIWYFILYSKSRSDIIHSGVTVGKKKFLRSIYQLFIFSELFS